MVNGLLHMSAGWQGVNHSRHTGTHTSQPHCSPSRWRERWRPGLAGTLAWGGSPWVSGGRGREMRQPPQHTTLDHSDGADNPSRIARTKEQKNSTMHAATQHEPIHAAFLHGFTTYMYCIRTNVCGLNVHEIWWNALRLNFCSTVLFHNSGGRA